MSPRSTALLRIPSILSGFAAANSSTLLPSPFSVSTMITDMRVLLLVDGRTDIRAGARRGSSSAAAWAADAGARDGPRRVERGDGGGPALREAMPDARALRAAAAREAPVPAQHPAAAAAGRRAQY